MQHTRRSLLICAHLFGRIKIDFLLNNFIHRETVYVQYKQTALPAAQEQTAIHEKKQARQSSRLHDILYSVIITMPINRVLERSLETRDSANNNY